METIQKIAPDRSNESTQLVERMDSAIGEASTSIGMIMSELVRRSLRGGVSDLGGSIQEFAREQVSVAIDDMMPTVSRTVEDLAENTAQRIAAEATERIGEELKSVELRTTEKSQEIASRVKAEAEAAIASVRVDVNASRDKAESTALDLKDLHQRAKDSWKKLQSELQVMHDARTDLDRRLSESSAQLQSVAQSLAEEQKLHETTRSQLISSQKHLDDTRTQLASSVRELSAITQQLSITRQELSETTRELSSTREALAASVKKQQTLDAQCRDITSRLEELERPKGLKALFSKFTGGGRKPEKPDGTKGLASTDDETGSLES